MNSDFLPAAALEEQLQLVDWVPDQVCYFCDAQRLPVSTAAPRGRPADAAVCAQEPPGAPSDYSSFKSFQMDLDEQSTGSDQASGNCLAAPAVVGKGSLLSPREVSASLHRAPWRHAA